MPKTSLEGSLFPNLEQEGRSRPHPKRGVSKKSNTAENHQKTEKIKAQEG